MRSSASSFCPTTQCALQNLPTMRFSILLKARMMQPRNWVTGTGRPWRKRNLPCIPRGNIRNLDTMSSQCAAEQDAWREVKDGWRPLYGDVDSMGVAVEWHDFRTARNFNWGRTFHPRSLEFCLNLQGHGEVGGPRKTDYAPSENRAIRRPRRSNRHRRKADANRLSLRARRPVQQRIENSSCPNYECCRAECKEGFFSSKVARSQLPSCEAASYVL